MRDHLEVLEYKNFCVRRDMIFFTFCYLDGVLYLYMHTIYLHKYYICISLTCNIVKMERKKNGTQ